MIIQGKHAGSYLPSLSFSWRSLSMPIQSGWNSWVCQSWKTDSYNLKAQENPILSSSTAKEPLGSRDLFKRSFVIQTITLAGKPNSHPLRQQGWWIIP
jgi:hypothetical protein